MRTYEFEGAMNCRYVTLNIVCTLTYDDDYLDIVEMFAYSDRKKELVKVSDRMALKFLEANWNFLERYCQDEERKAWERYRDDRDYIGDMKYQERKDREAEERDAA